MLDAPAAPAPALVVVTWIDRPDEVDRLLPGVLELAGSGIVTVDEVDVVGDAGDHLHHGRNPTTAQAR